MDSNKDNINEVNRRNAINQAYLENILMPEYEKSKDFSEALFKLNREDLEKENLDLIVDLAIICLHLAIFPDEKILLKLKELGLTKSELQFAININEISSVVSKLINPNKEEKQFILDFDFEKLINLISSHLGVNLALLVLKKFGKSALKNGIKGKYYDPFSEYLFDINRKLKNKNKLPFKDLIRKYYSENDKLKKSHIVNNIFIAHFHLDENNLIEILRGYTEKNILSQIIDLKAGVIRIINPHNEVVGKRQIILRLSPLFILLFPHKDLSRDMFEKRSAKLVKKEKMNPSKNYRIYEPTYEDFLFGNINSLLKSTKKKKRAKSQ